MLPPPSPAAVVQVIFPILVGRQHPPGHRDYPRMGSFFDVQGGGGAYPPRPSPPSNGAAARCLRDKARLPEEAVLAAEGRSVAEVVQVCGAPAAGGLPLHMMEGY